MSFLQEFEIDVAEFQCKVEDTDRRLGAIFCQAFDDASGLEHAFKVNGGYLCCHCYSVLDSYLSHVHARLAGVSLSLLVWLQA